MLTSLIALNRSKKRILMIATDVLLVSLCLWLAFCLRLGEWYVPVGNQYWLFVLATLLAVPVFYKFGMYRAIVRYIGFKATVAIVQATTVSVFAWTVLCGYFPNFFLGMDIWFPRSIPLLFWMALLILIVGSRYCARWIISGPDRKSRKGNNVVIYGAGIAGVELAGSLAHSKDTNVLGFVDDDARLHQHHIKNLKVLGGRDKISAIRHSVGQLEVLLAIPSVERSVRKDILTYLEEQEVSVRTLPSFNEIARGVAKLDELQEVDVADLLGRAQVEPDEKLLTACITDAAVLVTGAGGSIGSELCRQILPLRPKRLVLLEHSEYNLYEIDKELQALNVKLGSQVELIPVLGSVLNKPRVEEVIRRFDIETIYHAAAYKHVPIVEYNVAEGVRNNVVGTYTVAKAALDLQVANFVLISTDKAVRPTNVMGATKRLAELVVQGLHKESQRLRLSGAQGTHFTMVRFGNVLGSSGSVIPLFKKQIASGGPVTVTHADITRYFMTIPEAAQLVIQAGSMGLGGDVFVLDMGEPVKIDALARRMIHLSGYHVAEDGEAGIAIEYSGLRPGEKLYEELLIGGNVSGTDHPMIMTAEETSYEWSKMEQILDALEKALDTYAYEDARKILLEYVDGYNPQCGIEDLIWKRRVA